MALGLQNSLGHWSIELGCATHDDSVIFLEKRILQRNDNWTTFRLSRCPYNADYCEYVWLSEISSWRVFGKPAAVIESVFPPNFLI